MTLVERLRHEASLRAHYGDPILEEAADEIERLLASAQPEGAATWKEAEECPGDFTQLSRGQTKAYAWHRGVWWECDLPPLPSPPQESGR